MGKSLGSRNPNSVPFRVSSSRISHNDKASKMRQVKPSTYYPELAEVIVIYITLRLIYNNEKG